MKKKFIIGFCCATFLFIGIEIGFYFLNKPKYTLRLPEIETLESITIENKKIEDQAKMKEILNILNKETRKTRLESIQDAPTNGSEKLQINFHFIEQGASTIFVYKRKNDFYLEQPYNGIYKITEEEYEKIKEFVL